MILLLPVILAAVVWFWNGIWFRIIRDKLTVEVTVAGKAVEVGSALQISVRVRNGSWLPCPFVQLSLELPTGLSARPDVLYPGITRTTYLMMRQEISFETECYGWRRGLQDFRHKPVVLRLNEGFGIRELFVSREVSSQVVVYAPRALAVAGLAALRDINGDVERMRWLLPDEALLRGIRGYQPGDAFKHIAWHASARTGEWMTKQFSSSTDVSVGIILNAQFFDPHWQGTRVETFDALCGVLVALVARLDRLKIPVYFAANAIYPGRVKQLWYGRQQVGGLKWLTGSMLPYTNADMLTLLPLLHKYLPLDAPLLIFTAFLTESQRRAIAWEARRRKVYLVCPSEVEFPNMRGVQVIPYPAWDVYGHERSRDDTSNGNGNGAAPSGVINASRGQMDKQSVVEMEGARHA